jgi:hypothetical protein
MNPIVKRNLEYDLPLIRKFASGYTAFGAPTHAILSQFIVEGCDIAYYYGGYVSALQVYHLLLNEGAPEYKHIGLVVRAFAAKICEMMNQKNEESPRANL